MSIKKNERIENQVSDRLKREMDCLVREKQRAVSEINNALFALNATDWIAAHRFLCGALISITAVVSYERAVDTCADVRRFIEEDRKGTAK